MFLIVDEPQHIHEAITSLARVGLDRVEGVLAGGIEAWLGLRGWRSRGWGHD